MARLIEQLIRYTGGHYRSGGLLGLCRFFAALSQRKGGGIFSRLGPKRKSCPSCGWKGASFLPFIDPGYVTFGAECPVCGSHARHRGHALFYRRILKPDQMSGRLLYFAPEYNIRMFRNNPRLEVKTSEYGDAPADYRLDICDIDLPGESFEFIICHRVIEHLPDDRKGMRELYRILKPGGILIMSVPIDRDLDRTIEYGKPNPLETDHYYRYGLDFEKRIPPEFIVESHDFRSLFTRKEFGEMNLMDDAIFLCRKPDSGEKGVDGNNQIRVPV